jgi:prephenate dehydrogenase
MAAPLRKVAIVGLGLIGGSLARALRENGFVETLVGYDMSCDVLRHGADLGVIDCEETGLGEAVAGVDLVVISAPTLVAAELLAQVLALVPPSTVVTDVASVKQNLVEAAAGAPNFVPGHPIAGSERSGVDASRGDLFRDHRVILTPSDTTDREALELVRRMWKLAGAEVVEMGVSEHDAILAATSHLPHVLAYTLVDALSHSDLSDDIFRFAAGGFRDFTRIASSDPVMWRDIALANREELLKAIDSFSKHLGALRAAVDRADAEKLEQTFAHARSARETFIGKQTS